MPSILALDQGTTGSTALVVHQDGTVLGRGYREFTQHFPQPGWVEHDPEEIFRVSVEAMREAVAQAGERPAGLGITNQRETVVLWDRRTLEPVAPAIVWQDRRTTDRCRELRESGVEPMLRERTGLVADPYFSATKLEWLLRDDRLGAGRAPGRAGRRHGGELAGREAHRRPGARHRSYQRLAHAAVRSRLALRGTPSCSATFGVPRELLGEIVPSSGVVGETDPGHFGLSRCRSPAWPAISSRRSSGRAAAPTAWPRTPTAPAPFSWSRPATGCPTPARACWPRRPAARRASRRTRSRAASSSPAPRCSGCAMGSGSSRAAAESEALARERRRHRRGPLRARVRRAGHAALGAGGAGDDHRDHPGHHAGPSGAGRARGDGVQQRRPARRDDRLRRRLAMPALRVDGGAAANDWLMQFQADVLGVPVERPDMVETTALGAAGLAGLALGVWRSPASFLRGGGSSGSSRDRARPSAGHGGRGGTGGQVRRWRGRGSRRQAARRKASHSVSPVVRTLYSGLHESRPQVSARRRPDRGQRRLPHCRRGEGDRASTS